jgi:hypothetical protein
MRMKFWFLLAVVIAAATVPALARSRDDVMAGAYRCSAIADDKQWLDCFYGAAQPVRAQLGLPAASDSQLRMAAAPPAGGEIRNAMARDEVMAGAARCYLVADDRQWLNCYYDAAQPVRTLLKLSPAPKAAPAQVPEAPAFAVRKPAPAPVPGDGFTDWLAGSGKQRIVSRLASYNFDKYNIFTVTLANGQVWRQQDGHPHPGRPGEHRLAGAGRTAHFQSKQIAITRPTIKRNARPAYWTFMDQMRLSL